MKKNDFEKNIEKMIDPIEVGTIHFMQSYAKTVPKKLLYKIMKGGAKNNPYMGFVVEPYSLFLSYEIIDLEWAKRVIPDNYELVKSKMFDSDEPKYYAIFGCFNVHTSVFWGTRMEFYIIARNKDTGLLSWVIVDYDTNTVSYDKKNGLTAGNTKECVLTTNFDGELLVDIKGINRELVLKVDLVHGNLNKLDYQLWIDGNLSVAYGRDIDGDHSIGFSTIFHPREVDTALDLPLDNIELESNTWFEGKIATKPTKVACFQYAQHYLSDSPGHYSNIHNGKELKQLHDNFDFSKIPNYSSKSLKSTFKLGSFISFALVVLLSILLIIK